MTAKDRTELLSLLGRGASMLLGTQQLFTRARPPISTSRARCGQKTRQIFYNLPATHGFVPVAIEPLGPVNRTGREFLMALGLRMTTISFDPRETAHLFQRLSICSQRFNAIAFRGTFPQSSVSLDLLLFPPI